MASLTDIFSWFQTGDLPTETQFKSTFQSFFHKDEQIPTSAIQGFDTLLQGTATTEQVGKKANRSADNLSGDDVDKWKVRLGVGTLPTNIATIDPTKVNYVMMKDGTEQFAGDLGKNVGNSAVTSTANAGLTLGANWTLNAASYALYFTGLADKSNDGTFNRILVEDSSGKLAYSNGTTQFLKSAELLTDSQIDVLRTNLLKTNEAFSQGSAVIEGVSPAVVDFNSNYNSFVTLIGLNLFLNNTTRGDCPAD